MRIEPSLYLTNPNMQAFLQVLRHCEGTAGFFGYRKMFGGSLFLSYKDHPRKINRFKLKGSDKVLASSAAGAYQFLSRTWDEMKLLYDLPDFSPRCQDIAAIGLIIRRRALLEVLDGEFEHALRKCNKEWASLPGSPYGQPTKTIAECKKIYEKFGGAYVAR